MINKKLQLIDFSQGIKSTEIQHNFDVIQYQLDKERISVAGAGISYGLEFEVDGFNLKIKEGCLINNKGQEVYIDETIINVQKPILIEKLENNLVVNQYNRVYLSEIPYALNRLTIAENVDISSAGITIVKTGTEDNIPIASIEGKVLNLKPVVGTLANVSVDVKYYYTYRRRDVVYIDNDFKIKYREGITSPSPSIPTLNKDEYSYILGYIEVNGHSLNALTNQVQASLKVIKEFKSVRNVYTDSNNKLYLCGTPFESLKVIHLVEPSDPEENTFWYDLSTNRLKIWRATDTYTFAKEYVVETSDPNAEHKFATDIPYLYKGGQLSVYVNKKLLGSTQYKEGTDLSTAQQREDYIFSSEFQVLANLKKGDTVSYRIERTDGFMEWVTINDTSYIDLEERHIWTPEDMENEEIDFEHDKQHFFFHATNNKAMLFTPDSNALEIMINQIPLHNDQFKEITMIDAIASEDADMIKSKLVNYYGYPEEFNMEDVHEEYENIGIGFKLNAPLDENSYVEVRVKHRVNSSPIAKRFQRSATFVAEGTETYRKFVTDEYGNNIFNEPVFQTNGIYRYDENQLEVFLNGKRLEKGVEWEEVKQKTRSLKAVPCDSFYVLPQANIQDGDRVSHRLTTNVYSYDHVEAILSNFNVEIDECKQIVEETKEVIDTTKEEVDKKIEIVETQIEQVQQITNNLDSTYMKKNDVLGNQNIDASILAGIMSSSFNHAISVTSSKTYDITNICTDKDFTLLFNLNDNNGNKILKRNTGDNDEYMITTQGSTTTLTLLSPSIQEGHKLYLTGIKFGV